MGKTLAGHLCWAVAANEDECERVLSQFNAIGLNLWITPLERKRSAAHDHHPRESTNRTLYLIVPEAVHAKSLPGCGE